MTQRNVYILLSSHALSYARLCITTMLSQSLEPLHLRLVVDNPDEKTIFEGEVAELEIEPRHTVSVIEQGEVGAVLAERYPNLSGLRALHEGHPCWRKITDPLILSQPDDEIIVTDPDLYFPNQYAFEPTPQDGVMMMRQGPNCLYPPEAVRECFDKGIALANHVDIGVAQLRAGAVDIEWLDWVAGSLDLDAYRPFMHIEAIIWSAIAMKIGGGHLNATAWKCWERGKFKRLAVAAGVPGRLTLKLEPLPKVKCIHVSGPSKWWVTEAVEKGLMKPLGNTHGAATPTVPYVELTRDAYEREQKIKETARKLGLYKLTKSV